MPAHKAQDDAEEFAHFSAFSDLNYVPNVEKTMPFRAVAAVLQISSKYTVDPLFGRVAFRLGKTSPVIMDDIPENGGEALEKELFGHSLTYADYEQLSRLFQECHLERFLLQTYYIISQADTEYLADVLVPQSVPTSKTAILIWEKRSADYKENTACSMLNRFAKAGEV
ncbi:hypothetical protein M422DRAFT_776425 [Sphaerobolus stellatus SS14]|nr:hypothetical protein M422DRAFT_776425 [Sphaerobolus stellatus SS14]